MHNSNLSFQFLSIQRNFKLSTFDLCKTSIYPSFKLYIKYLGFIVIAFLQGFLTVSECVRSSQGSEKSNYVNCEKRTKLSYSKLSQTCPPETQFPRKLGPSVQNLVSTRENDSLKVGPPLSNSAPVETKYF